MTKSTFDLSRLIPTLTQSNQSSRATSGPRPHVVIVGGGFAGLAAARRLRNEPVDVTIIDRNAYNTFQPLLYQVATATLNPGDVTWALRSVHGRDYGARFILGEVATMDHDARHLYLHDGRIVWYDYLILCTGVVVNFFGIEGAAEHSYPLYTRRQALALRDATQHALEAAARNPRSEDLRVVIVGAGPTGVETAGAMAEMGRADLPVLFPELDLERIHITLVEMAPNVLMPFSEDSRNYTADALRKRGVDLRLGTSVTSVNAEGVMLSTKDGDETHEEFLPAQIVVWASGIQAPEVVGRWGFEQGKGGRIVTDKALRAVGHERVLIAGDISLQEDSPLPQQAQPALQTGKHAGAVIAADVAGQEVPTFDYHDLGSLATIGRSDAVAETTVLPDLTGFPAWLVWNAVHIRALLGGRNRIASMVNLGTKYIFWSRDHNVIVGDPGVTLAEGERSSLEPQPLSTGG